MFIIIITMDNYNNNKTQLLNLHLKCNKYDSWIDIIAITGGSGGSNSVVLIGKINDIKVVLKCTPLHIKRNFMKEIPNRDLIEIEIYKYLSKKYLDGNITPHIVGIYQHKKCNDIRKIFNKKCPSVEQLLTNKKFANKEDKICAFNKRINRFQNKLHLLLLEFCPLKIDGEFEKLIKNLKNKKITILEIENFIYRVIFQILFTLSHLQHKEKQFYHGDLFLRNILGTNECSMDSDDYVEYNFKNKKFYLSANGFYTKISDFGTTIISPKYIANDITNKEFYGDNKTDVFAFLKDLYDGQNLGATSLMEIAKNNKINKKDINKLRNIYKKFIDVDKIDKINKINKQMFNWIWHIKEYSFLKRMVKEPHRYMNYNYFGQYKTLPTNGRVIKIFGLNENQKGGNINYFDKYVKYKSKYINLKNK